MRRRLSRWRVTAEVVGMTRTHVSPDQHRQATRNSVAATPRADSPKRTRMSPFWRHFVQMLGAMMVGMLATGAIFLSVVGAKTWDEVTTGYPTQALLAMAAGMTIPMVVWM